MEKGLGTDRKPQESEYTPAWAAKWGAAVGAVFAVARQFLSPATPGLAGNDAFSIGQIIGSAIVYVPLGAALGALLLIVVKSAMAKTENKS